MNIFITGATSGIGLALVQKFIREGHFVIASGRRQKILDKLKIKHKGKIHTLQLDVRNKDEVLKCIHHLPRKIKNIDILVNNAGLALGMDLFQNSSSLDTETVIDTNVKGLVYCTQSILPIMIKRNKGHIINIGSVAGEFPYPGGNIYGASKAFVHQLTLNLKADLLGTNIRVSTIEPGMCGETEFSKVRFRGDTFKANKVYENMKPLNPKDVAETIYWVATRPPHVNINVISMMPVQQAFQNFAVHRTTSSNF